MCNSTKSEYNKTVVEAMTDEELFEIRDLIIEELKFRQTDFLTIPHFNGGMSKYDSQP